MPQVPATYTTVQLTEMLQAHCWNQDIVNFGDLVWLLHDEFLHLCNSFGTVLLREMRLPRKNKLTNNG